MLTEAVLLLMQRVPLGLTERKEEVKGWIRELLIEYYFQLSLRGFG